MVLCLPGNRISQALYSHLVLVSRARKINAVELRVRAGLEVKAEVGSAAPLRLRADGHDAQLVYSVALLDRVEFERVRTGIKLYIVRRYKPLVYVPASCAGYRDRSG